ncbi:MAG: hypothetical protein P4M11_02990 [Candidatus Pacebacteria bacterium]|nr:hypothetical protein [Candidatus Paceibacterota bacterium]
MFLGLEPEEMLEKYTEKRSSEEEKEGAGGNQGEEDDSIFDDIMFGGGSHRNDTQAPKIKQSLAEYNKQEDSTTRLQYTWNS